MLVETTCRPVGRPREDIFHHVYGALPLPAYRTTFADDLKLELPRTPFRGDFRAFADAGRRLAGLHVGYEEVEPRPLRWEYAAGTKLSYHVDKMKLDKDKAALAVNETPRLAAIPPEVFAHRSGDRSRPARVIDR